MKKRLIALIVVAAALGVPFIGTARAATIPALCVVGDAGPAHIQAGFAPGGPGDCTVLP